MQDVANLKKARKAPTVVCANAYSTFVPFINSSEQTLDDVVDAFIPPLGIAEDLRPEGVSGGVLLICTSLAGSGKA